MKKSIISLALIPFLLFSFVFAAGLENISEEKSNAQGYTPIDDIKDAFNEAVLLYQLNNIRTENEMRAFLEEYFHELGINWGEFETLSASNQSNVINSLRGKSYASINEFANIFYQSVERAKEASGGGSSSGGSGGGGSSGVLKDDFYFNDEKINILNINSDVENKILSFDIDWLSETDTPLNIFLCVYDSENRLYKTMKQSLEEQFVEFNYSSCLPDGDYRVKCFIWDNKIDPLSYFELNI